MGFRWRKTSRSLQKKLKISKKYYPLLALIFVSFGLFLIFLPSFYKETVAEEPIKIDSSLLNARERANPPVRIKISSVKIDLPVVEAKVVKGYWETSASSASHGVGSASPGEVGNMVIFAHARKGLFLPLRKVKMGEIVEVFTQNQKYRYQIFEIKEVTPDQVEVISQTSDERLTLYTCSGFLDSKRLVVVANPIK